MGYTSTFKFVNLGIKRSVFRKLKKPTHQWDMMKNMLDSLIKQERIETTMAKAKELQQYAEEIIILAKKDNKISDLKVESMLRTAAARKKLFEVLIPRFENRNFYFTRIINEWRFRMRDASNMAYIEYVDSPIELRPAKPVGFEKIKYIWSKMNENRRNFRKWAFEAKKLNLLDENNKLKTDISDLQKPSKYNWSNEGTMFTLSPSEDFDIKNDNNDLQKISSFEKLIFDRNKAKENEEITIDTQNVHDSLHVKENKGINVYTQNVNKTLKMKEGNLRGIEPFYVDVNPPHQRSRTDRFVRKRNK